MIPFLSDQIGLHDVIDQNLFLARIARDQIVSAGGCIHVPERANGDNEGIVRRASDSAVAAGSHRIVPAFIACRCHNHDSRGPGALDRLTQRIPCVTLKHWTSDGQVNNADVKERFKLYRAVDGSEHGAVRACAIGPKHAEVDDIRAGRILIPAAGARSVSCSY